MRIRQPWPIVRSRQRERDFAALFGAVPPGALGDMLEIGSGDGFNASLLAPLGKSLTTSEPSAGRAKFATELPRVRCSATALPFPDGSFDFIFSSSVLEHIRDRVSAFAEIKRCLRPGGVMIHVMPSTTWKWLQLIFYYPHVAVSGLEMIGAPKQLPEQTSTELWHTGGKKPTWWQEFKTGVLPPVHGEFNGHVREMIGFRAKSWRRELEAAGFAVKNRLRLPLCSGYGFGLERLRWVGEKCGMSAHNAFVVTHAGEAPALPGVLAMTEPAKKKGLKIPKWIDKVLLVIGFGLLGYVISRYPFDDIKAAVSRMFPLVLLTPLIALAWMCTATTALYTLLERAVPWWKILWIRLVGDSYNALLPMAGFGGEPFKLRQLSYYLSPTVLMSTFIRDRVLDNVIGFLWGAMGCIVGVLSFALDDRVQIALFGYAAVCLVIGVFGTALVLTRVPGKLGGWLAKLLGDVAPEKIEPLPARRVAVILFWYTCSRALGLLEKVTLLWILGAPHDFASAAFVDGFLSAAGYIGFMIPQGLGVFEGATIYVLGVLGAPGPSAIAFAFARRGRMLVVGLFGISLHVGALARKWFKK